MNYIAPAIIIAAGLGLSLRIGLLRTRCQIVPVYMQVARTFVAAIGAISLLIALHQQGVI